MQFKKVYFFTLNLYIFILLYYYIYSIQSYIYYKQEFLEYFLHLYKLFLVMWLLLLSFFLKKQINIFYYFCYFYINIYFIYLYNILLIILKNVMWKKKHFLLFLSMFFLYATENLILFDIIYTKTLVVNFQFKINFVYFNLLTSLTDVQTQQPLNSLQLYTNTATTTWNKTFEFFQITSKNFYNIFFVPIETTPTYLYINNFFIWSLVIFFCYTLYKLTK